MIVSCITAHVANNKPRGKVMTDNQQEIENLGKRFGSEIERLDRMALNIIAVNSLQFIYNRLMTLKVEMNRDFFMEVEALTTGLVISYGRLFSQTTGTTKLKRSAVPEHLQPTHDELIELRHSRYAHHGNHGSIDSGIELLFDGEKVTVNPQLKMGFWVGASKAWEPLFVWLSGYLLDCFNQQLAHLTKLSGVEWTMNYGERPTWA